MISAKEIKIKKIDNFDSDYIETVLENMGFDVLRWAITDIDDEYYTLNLAVLQE